MKATGMTQGDSYDYVRTNYGRFIGTSEVIENCIGQPGITLNFYKPDETVFIHIVGQDNRNSFVDCIYDIVNNMFEISHSFRTSNPIF